jgi:hypothetical protein
LSKPRKRGNTRPKPTSASSSKPNEHCRKAEREAQVLLIEPRGTVDTGDAGCDLTAAELEI